MIRKARHSDTDRIIEIAKQEVLKSRYSHIETDDEVFKAYMLSFLLSPQAEVWVAEVDGIIEGVLVGVYGQTYFSRANFVTDKFFLVTEKGSGLGIRLFRAFLSWAKKQPNVAAIELTLTAGMPDQERTAEMYKKFGFVEAGNTFHLGV